MILASALAFTLALPRSTLAERDPICPFPEQPDRCVAVGLKKGDRIPFDGDLFTVPYAVWLNQRVDGIAKEIAAAVTATAAAYKADLRFERRIHEIELERRDTVHGAEKEALRSQIPSWYERPLAVAAITAIVTAIVMTVLYVETGLGERLRDEVRSVR